MERSDGLNFKPVSLSQLDNEGLSGKSGDAARICIRTIQMIQNKMLSCSRRHLIPTVLTIVRLILHFGYSLLIKVEIIFVAFGIFSDERV